jgi:hypothetical protein
MRDFGRAFEGYPDERRPIMKSSQCLAMLGVTVGMTFAFEAKAVSVPTFTSPPVVAANTSDLSLLPTTLIFGYMSGNLWVISKTGSGVGWNLTDGHHTFIQGGYDGKPAASYLAPGSTITMTCGHSATPPGYMYCNTGELDRQIGGHYETFERRAYTVGTGTFPAGASPVLAYRKNQGTNWMILCARGMNDQIWCSGYSGGKWAGWSQIPAPLSDSFYGDPALSSYVAANDLLMVCARKRSSQKIACAKQVYGPFGSLEWSSWDTVPNQPDTVFGPALTRGYSSVFLFGIRSGAWDEAYTTAPLDSGAWASYTGPIGLGSSLSTPSAIGSQSSFSGSGISHVLNVAQAGDGAYWFTLGGPNSGTLNTTFIWGDWTQIQVN